MYNCDSCKMDVLEKSKYLTWREEPVNYILLKININKIIYKNNKKYCSKCISNKINIK
jgi:hypothetical protein